MAFQSVRGIGWNEPLNCPGVAVMTAPATINWTGSMGGVGIMFCGERRKRPNRDGLRFFLAKSIIAPIVIL